MVQWLGLGTFIAVDPSSILGQGPKILKAQAVQLGQKKKGEREGVKKVKEGHTRCGKSRKTTLCTVSVTSPTGVV